MSRGYRLRPQTDEDIPFLMQLYASTRQDEMAPVPWTDEEKHDFLAGQFQTQRHYYSAHFPGCAFDVLVHDAKRVGRLYLDRRRTGFHVIDIALLPDWRGRGVGTAILQALQVAARASGKGVGMMVEKFNPALRLYRRLGFVEIADHGIYLEMAWPPEDDQLNVA